MNSSDVRNKYLKFFEERGHKVLPSSSLIPENDPTTLFNSAGMQPLVPYLLGESHPLGKRLVDVQKCLRTDDIEEVGDETHHTFFEMLGNWSLGDYFKEDAIKYSFEFLTSPEWLNIPKEKLAISVFAGDEDAPFDQKSFDIWTYLGIPEKRIAKLPKKNNWWGPAGLTGPCGPDTEMFYWASDSIPPEKFDPDDDNWVEIWNDVFMQYFKNEDGSFKLLDQKNVDTGMGLERITAVFQGTKDNYRSDLFWPIIENLQADLNVLYGTDEKITRTLRIVADHIKAATFLIKDGVVPSNKLQGYVLRRLLRRAAVKLEVLREDGMSILPELALQVAEIYQDTDYLTIKEAEEVKLIIKQEIDKFRNTLSKGLKEFDKYVTAGFVGKPETQEKLLSPQDIFRLYESYGFPYELSKEIGEERGIKIPPKEEFDLEAEKHKELSRTTSAGMFKGGLADQTERTTKLHTANHLLQAALRQVIGEHLGQRGSNITAERLRFDFNHDQKLTEQQLKQVEDLVNQKIKEDLKVWYEIRDKEQALKEGALSNYGENYPEKVKVYKMSKGDQYFSKELCGGPHVEHTKVLGKFKILKQESISAGIKRIYATVED